MRFWLSGPRIYGIRPGVSFGPEDVRALRGRGAPADGVPKAFALVCLIAGGVTASMFAAELFPDVSRLGAAMAGLVAGLAVFWFISAISRA